MNWFPAALRIAFLGWLILVPIAQPQSGLIARYLLNNNAMDSVGTNHGTIVNASPIPDRFGQLNAAYSFDGVSSHIAFAVPPPLLQFNSWTISAWVKPGNLAQEGLAVFVGLDDGEGSDGFGFGLSGGAELQGFAVSRGGFFGSGLSFQNAVDWVHVAVVRTNTVLYFYLNTVSSIGIPGVGMTDPTDMTIGSQNGVRHFGGGIDDVRIYNRALSPTEINYLYQNSDGPCYPHSATASAVVINGFVVAANVIDGACGYTNAPTVSFVGGGGSNATATATISNGVVTGITMVSAGCCYTNPPTVVLSSPPIPSKVSIKISKFKVTQQVTPGRTYVLESSSDLSFWSPAAPPFTAQTELVITEVDAETNGRFFRTREIIQ